MVMRGPLDAMRFMEEIGFEKHVTPYMTEYIPTPQIGDGFIRVIGDMNQWYYLDIHYSSVISKVMEFDMQEAFMAINILAERSDNGNIPEFIDFQANVSPSASRFFLNHNPNMAGSILSHANDIHWDQRTIVIREKAYRKHLEPVFAMAKEKDIDEYSLLKQAGKRCAFYYYKALAQLHSDELQPHTLSLLLNSSVYGILAEIEDQARQITCKEKLLFLNTYERNAIQCAIGILKENLSDAPDVAVLARKIGLGEQKLQMGFKEVTGMTVARYLRSIRMEKAAELLKGDALVNEIAREIGYTSTSRFIQAFEQVHEVTPLVFRKYQR